MQPQLSTGLRCLVVTKLQSLLCKKAEERLGPASWGRDLERGLHQVGSPAPGVMAAARPGKEDGACVFTLTQTHLRGPREREWVALQ
jgi:hypothetical protein